MDILDVIDAQSEAFDAEQQAALARYQYLSDVIELQRALSWFVTDKTEAEIEAWLFRAREVIDAEMTQKQSHNVMRGGIHGRIG